MHVEQLRRTCQAFVDLWAVFHGACALSYVYVAVNSDILLGKVVVVPHKLELCDLGKICRILPNHVFRKGSKDFFF